MEGISFPLTLQAQLGKQTHRVNALSGGATHFYSVSQLGYGRRDLSCLRLTENENWDTSVIPDTAGRILCLEAVKLLHLQVRAFSNRELHFNSPSKFKPKIAFPFPELSQLR